MTDKVNLKEILDEWEDAPFFEINSRIFAMLQMNEAQRVLAAEVTDILNEKDMCHFEVKLNWKKIDELLKNQFAKLNHILSKEDLDTFVADNLKFQNVIRANFGIEKGHRVFVHEINAVENNYKMTVNIIGDVFLRRSDGWQINIPKEIALSNTILREKYEEAKDNPAGVPVAMEMYIH